MTLQINQKFNCDGEYIFSVSEFNAATDDLLDQHFGEIVLQGEVNNFKKYTSGHLYFHLKDSQASIHCVLFRRHAAGLAFTPQDGDNVTVRARASVYQARGTFQLIVSQMQTNGTGDLRQQFLLLQQKLKQAGLFDDTLKRPIPRFPKQIGIITSPDGAALHDVLTVLGRRFPALPIRIYATPVQGDAAPRKLIRAITYANRENCCDVLLLTRGGGTLEDLSVFNDEALAHAIVASQIPIVCAVGHEVDFTIADWVADQRAATPSAAAEMISPQQTDFLRHILQLFNRIKQHVQNKMQYHVLYLQQLATHLAHASKKWQAKQQHLDMLSMRLEKLMHNILHQYRTKINHHMLSLQKLSPQQQMVKAKTRLSQLHFQLKAMMSQMITTHQSKIATLAGKLDAISPLATLSRGYSITYNAQNQVISYLQQVKVGDAVDVKLQDGMLNCQVLTKHK